jgi:MFS family permease
LAVGLGVLGFGAAIYHPVGLAWVVRNADRPGSALAWVGIAGAFGISLAAIVTAFLSGLISWRAAFIVPGAVTVATGLLLSLLVLRGTIRDAAADIRPQPKAGRADMIRAFVILSVTMFCAGLIYNTTQTAMPKWFDQRMAGLLGTDVAAGVGLLVTLVYLLASGAQLLGGWAADRFQLKLVYAGSLMLQAPLLLVAASLSDMPLFAVAVLMVFMTSFQIPAESLMLARYTPPRHRGLAFGAKFVLSFGAAPFGVAMISWVYGRDQSFFWVFAYLAGFALLSFAAALLLPGEDSEDKATASAPAAVSVAASGGAD